MLKKTIRTLLETCLSHWNYELKYQQNPPKGYPAFLRTYNSIAAAPGTVFDIGVGRGTPWLYDGFPQSKLVLIEALEDFKPSIDPIREQRNADIFFCALSETEGEVDFHVPFPHPTGASLYARDPKLHALRSKQGRGEVRKRTVSTRPLDSITAAYAPPFVIKIDVEGAELNVLRGAERTLESTDLILAETSVMRRWVGASDLTDVAAYLKPKGFALFDIVELSAIGAQRVLSYVDVAFIRTGADFYARVLDEQ
jgi:FkbM family methyltransferase